MRHLLQGCLRELATAGLILMVTTLPAAAQLPETFTNLKVLPEAIEQRALIDTMRFFSGALGVRCPYCHVGQEGQPLSEYDFASDAKETKRVARQMLRMTTAINQEHLPRTERKDLLEVSCATCHRGLERPLSLGQDLEIALAEGGTAAAVARYQELREEYYGTGSYDFSQSALRRLGERLLGTGQPEAATVVLALNVEHFPESGFSHYLLGEARLATGDRDGALESFRRAHEFSPENPRARQKVEELEAAAGGGGDEAASGNGG